MDRPASAESPASPALVRTRLFGAAIVDLLIVMAVGGGTLGLLALGLLAWELGLTLAFLAVAWRAPAGGLWRRVGFAWLHMTLVVLGAFAVKGLAEMYADAPDIIWFSLRTAWHSGVEAAAFFVVALAVGACAGGLVAWMLRRRWSAASRTDELPGLTPASWDRFIMLGTFVLASALCLLVGWKHEDEILGLLLSVGFLVVALRAPKGALWRRVWSAWAATALGVVLIYLAACLLVHLDPRCDFWWSGADVWLLSPAIFAIRFAVVAVQGGGLAWLIRRWRPAKA